MSFHLKIQQQRFASTTATSSNIISALSLKNGIFCCCKQRRRNQQRNKQKTRKYASDIKKPKNVDVLTKTAKRNAL